MSTFKRSGIVLQNHPYSDSPLLNEVQNNELFADMHEHPSSSHGDGQNQLIQVEDEYVDDIAVIVRNTTDVSSFGFSLRKLLAYTGPGWLMSIAFLDLGSLESDLQAGALTGYRLLWLLLWSHIIGLIYQILSARLGVVTGRNLAEHLRISYPKRVLGILWGFIELALVGTDTQLVIGNAIAIQVLFGAPLWLGVLLTALNIPFFSLVSYLSRSGNGQRGKRVEWCFAGAIGVMAGCFFWVMLLSKPNLYDMLSGLLIPDVPKKARMQAVGLFGATVVPHNIILHSALVKSTIDRVTSESIDHYRNDISKSNDDELQQQQDLKYFTQSNNKYWINETTSLICHNSGCSSNTSRESLYSTFNDNILVCRRTIKEINFYLSLESSLTLFISFLINCAILISFACVFPLHQNHNTNCKLPGLYEGAKVLETAIGPLGPLLWGCGLLAAGQTATVTVTLAGQQVLEGFWRQSVSAWRRIAGTRIVSFVPALIVASLWPKHIDMLGEWFNVLQSICLPIALVPLLRLTSSRSVMGEFCNSRWLRYLGWLLLIMIIIMNGVLYADLFDRYIGSTIIGYVLLSGAGLGILAYLGFCIYITICPLKLVDALPNGNE